MFGILKYCLSLHCTQADLLCILGESLWNPIRERILLKITKLAAVLTTVSAVTKRKNSLCLKKSRKVKSVAFASDRTCNFKSLSMSSGSVYKHITRSILNWLGLSKIHASAWFFPLGWHSFIKVRNFSEGNSKQIWGSMQFFWLLWWCGWFGLYSLSLTKGFQNNNYDEFWCFMWVHMLIAK